MVNFQNILESLFGHVLIISVLQSLPGIRNSSFYSFQTKELKKNPNIDLLSFDGEFRKYFDISFLSCFDNFWAPKSLPGIRHGCFYSFQTIKLKKTQNIDFLSFDGEFRKYFRVSFWSCFDNFCAPITSSH